MEEARGEPWYTRSVGHCHACGAELPRDLPIFRETECPRCSKPLKVCLNCTFYERGLQWDCRESIAEPVHDKERANFCDYFRLREGLAAPGGLVQERAEQARDAFDSLFE